MSNPSKKTRPVSDLRIDRMKETLISATMQKLQRMELPQIQAVYDTALKLIEDGRQRAK